MKHIKDAPVPPTQWVMDLPARVSAIVLKMLAKKPEERFQTYSELIESLAEVGEQKTGAARTGLIAADSGVSQQLKTSRTIWSRLFGK